MILGIHRTTIFYHKYLIFFIHRLLGSAGGEEQAANLSY
jgi:hypothetical protein